MLSLFIVLLSVIPRPSLAACWGFDEDWIFTDTCISYCEERRPSGNSGEFKASCEVPDVIAVHTNGGCLSKCVAAKCPCQSCPEGNYVNCPGIPVPTTAPSSASSFYDSPIYNSPIWIIVVIVAIMVIGIIVSSIVSCCKRQRRIHIQQQPHSTVPSTAVVYQQYPQPQFNSSQDMSMYPSSTGSYQQDPQQYPPGQVMQMHLTNSMPQSSQMPAAQPTSGSG